ncbi:MAG: MBL fold metallo-hydrolase [Proteobacteria bacterium]|nr:MBL fold metallo-hydrolase [Pseudomonadota bacterium]
MLELLEDFFFIERGLLNGNHFVWRGPEPVLIDTAYVSDFDQTRELIESLGVDLPRVGRIVNTHSHCDHVGGNRRIQELSGCRIAMHYIGKHFIDTRDDWSTWWRYYAQDADFFDCQEGLRDGDILTVGPHEFEVLHTPGHSADGLMLYHRPSRLLISADTLWEKDMAVLTQRVEGSRAVFLWLATLDRLSALEIDRVCPGHGPPFEDAQGAIARTRRRLERFLDDRTRMGPDLLKKILIYTLFMRGPLETDRLFSMVMAPPWFRETVDLYLGGDYRSRFDEIIDELVRRGLLENRGGLITPTGRP